MDRIPDAVRATAPGITLGDLALGLARSVTAPEVLEVVAELGPGLVGADRVTISLLDGRRNVLRLVASRHTPAAVTLEFAEYPADAPLPSTDALREGRTVAVHDVAERDRRWPALAGTSTGSQAWTVSPLIYQGRCLGLLSLSWHVPQAFDAEHRTAIDEVVRLCAASLTRTQAFHAEETARAVAERATARLTALQTLTTALAAATTPEAVGRIVTASAAPEAGATAGVMALWDGDRTIRMLAGTGLARQVVAGTLHDVDDVPLMRDLVARREPVVHRSREDWDPTGRAGALIRQEAWVVLPLTTADRVVGGIAFGWDEARAFTPDELEFLRTLAAHSATALDRARLLAASRTTAEVLQRALLPPRPPSPPGWSLGSSYQPAVEGTQVGGDWYDAFELPGGRLGLVIGDVMGNGIHAATVMGSLRAALRGFTTLDPDPARVLTALDGYLTQFGGEETATCLYAVLDVATGELGYASAGHPPALVVAPGQPARWLDGATSQPLGVPTLVPEARARATARIAPGELLLLYTDGLVEDRATPIADGMERLAQAAAALAAGPGTRDLNAGAAELIVELSTDHRHADDVATLLVQRADGQRADGQRARTSDRS